MTGSDIVSYLDFDDDPANPTRVNAAVSQLCVLHAGGWWEDGQPPVEDSDTESGVWLGGE
jgi:hypothetical protein